MEDMWWKRGELVHSFLHSFFSLSLCACLRAEILRGRGFHNEAGRLFLGLDSASPFAANFASLSATSFPSTSS